MTAAAAPSAAAVPAGGKIKQYRVNVGMLPLKFFERKNLGSAVERKGPVLLLVKRRWGMAQASVTIFLGTCLVQVKASTKRAEGSFSSAAQLQTAAAAAAPPPPLPASGAIQGGIRSGSAFLPAPLAARLPPMAPIINSGTDFSLNCFPPQKIWQWATLQIFLSRRTRNRNAVPL